jgi:hypothetical protein
MRRFFLISLGDNDSSRTRNDEYSFFTGLAVGKRRLGR